MQISLQNLSKTLKKYDTYPGIIKVLQSILQREDADKQLIKELTNPITLVDTILAQAVEKQLQIGLKALAKGLVTRKWATVQQMWCSTAGYRYDGQKWPKVLIMSLQTYTRAMWIHRNTILHGKTIIENNEILKYKCKMRIKELYKRSRLNLTLEDKKLFKLPLQYRMKGTAEGMLLWIERAEMVFQHKDQDKDNNLNTKRWCFKMTKKWRKLVPSGG